MYSYTQSNSFWKIQELAEWLLHIERMRKYPHWIWIGKAGTHSHHQPHPQHCATQSGKKFEPPASPWETKSLDHISSSQLLRLPLKRQAPTHLALKAKGACVHQTHKTTANKESVLKGHMSPCEVSLMSSVHWEEAKTPPLPVFP